MIIAAPLRMSSAFDYTVCDLFHIERLPSYHRKRFATSGQPK
jgi:hypothetical protein